MEVEIVRIHKKDAHYRERNRIVGQTGKISNLQISSSGVPGYVSCELESYNGEYFIFHAVMLKSADAD